MSTRRVDGALWRRSLLVLAAFVLAALAIETSTTLRFAAYGIEPNLLLALIYYFARYEGAVPGAVLGFAVGLLEDLSAPRDLGVHALAKCLVGFAIGKLWAEQRLFKDNLRAQSLTLLAAGLAHDLVVFTFLSRGSPAQLFPLFFRIGVPTAVYTALVCPLLVSAWSWLRQKGPRLHERLFRLG